MATILVGHVTKDGAVAGPRVLEHLVDCVLQFEGDRHHEHRVLRATKNRFGSTNELGVFEMTGAGLVGVVDPSELFGATHPGEIGAAVGCVLEGHEAAAARDPGARLADRPRDAPARGHRCRSEASRHDRRRARPPRGGCARERGRLRQRRGRRADRGARSGSRRCARHRVGVAWRLRRRGLRSIRRDRPHRPAPPASQSDRRIEECAKLGIAAVSRPQGAPGRTGPRVIGVDTLRAALGAGLERAPQPPRPERVRRCPA